MSDVRPQDVTMVAFKQSLGSGGDGVGDRVNDIKTGTDFNPSEELAKYGADPTTACAGKFDTGGMPPEFIGGKGTTVYKPLRSDPRVEKVIGEKKYNPAKTREKSADQYESELAKMRADMQMLKELLGAKVTEPEPEPEPDTTEREPLYDYDNMSYQELKAMAIELDPSVNKRLSKSEYADMIENSR